MDSERSFSTPVVVGDRIYLTGGIAGEFGGGAFGSVPKLMCFRDLCDSAFLEWDTTSIMPPTSIGGTTFHLVYAAGRLYAGSALPFPLDFDYDDLYILDASLTPDDPGFVIDHVSGVGASPALVDGVLYTIGFGGLFAFASPDPSPDPIPGDIDLNGVVDLLDFSFFAQCFGGCGLCDLPSGCTFENWERSNLDGTGCITLNDFATFAGNFGTSQ